MRKRDPSPTRTTTANFINDRTGTIDLDISADASVAVVSINDLKFKCDNGVKFTNDFDFTFAIEHDKIKANGANFKFTAFFDGKSVFGTFKHKDSGCKNPHQVFTAKR